MTSSEAVVVTVSFLFCVVSVVVTVSETAVEAALVVVIEFSLDRPSTTFPQDESQRIAAIAMSDNALLFILTSPFQKFLLCLSVSVIIIEVQLHFDT